MTGVLLHALAGGMAGWLLWRLSPPWLHGK